MLTNVEFMIVHSNLWRPSHRHKFLKTTENFSVCDGVTAVTNIIWLITLPVFNSFNCNWEHFVVHAEWNSWLLSVLRKSKTTWRKCHFLWKIFILITISFVTVVTGLWRGDGRHTPSLIGFFYRNQFPNPHGLGTIQTQIYSSLLKQLRFCKLVKKCAKYPTVHFFFRTGFSHFQRYFSTSSLSLNLKCFTVAEIAKLYLQTIPFGILILLPGAEKKSFESVSNVTGHPVDFSRFCSCDFVTVTLKRYVKA